MSYSRSLAVDICKQLGVDPNNTASIRLTPNQAHVQSFIRDAGGNLVPDWHREKVRSKWSVIPITDEPVPRRKRIFKRP